MVTAIKIRGRVEKGRIVTDELPFEEGQVVEIQAEVKPDPASMSTEEWLEAFDKWNEDTAKRYSHLPVLSDEAMSRESIYEDRGL